MDWHRKNSWTGYSFDNSLFPDEEVRSSWLVAAILRVLLPLLLRKLAQTPKR